MAEKFIESDLLSALRNPFNAFFFHRAAERQIIKFSLLLVSQDNSHSAV